MNCGPYTYSLGVFQGKLYEVEVVLSIYKPTGANGYYQSVLSFLFSSCEVDLLIISET